MSDKKKKKEHTTVVLPKAWQSVKHRNETSQAKTNYEDTWKAISTIIIVLVVLFVLMGGVSQTGVLKAVFNWSHNVGTSVANWLEGGAIVTNENGIYIDPSGQTGEKIGDENASDIVNISDKIDDLQNNESGNNESNNEQSTENQNSEVQNE